MYDHWCNNGKYHTGIQTYPEERYAGKRDESWYDRLVKALKLEDVLTIWRGVTYLSGFNIITAKVSKNNMNSGNIFTVKMSYLIIMVRKVNIK